jgi:hypothetical protein
LRGGDVKGKTPQPRFPTPTKNLSPLAIRKNLVPRPKKEIFERSEQNFFFEDRNQLKKDPKARMNPRSPRQREKKGFLRDEVP